MNRATLSIYLQNKHAWPLRIVGVILDNHRYSQTTDRIAHADRVRGKLIIAVKRHAYFTPCHKRLDLFQGLAQIPPLQNYCSKSRPVDVLAFSRQAARRDVCP